jgi:hypothetical protein
LKITGEFLHENPRRVFTGEFLCVFLRSFLRAEFLLTTQHQLYFTRPYFVFKIKPGLFGLGYKCNQKKPEQNKW